MRRYGGLAWLLYGAWAQTAFQADPFLPLEDYAPTPPPSRTVLGTPSPLYWQNRADYIMDLRLDPATHRLYGHARLTYTHQGPFPLSYLWLAVEPNYFSLRSYGHLSRNFLWEDFRRDVQRGQATPLQLYARQIQQYLKTNFQLEALFLEEGNTLRPLAYRLEETLMEVTLPFPLHQGQSVTLQLRWRFTLNDATVEGRGGYLLTEKGPIYQVAQYYPRPVLLNDVRGWQKMPYYGPSEFATEFGTYEVTIRVPRGYVVAATGVLQNPTEVLSPTQLARWQRLNPDSTIQLISASELPTRIGKDTLAWRFRAENVRDFAFATSPRYIWEARYTHVAGASQPTLIQSFYPPEVAPLWKNLALAAAEHTLHEYSRYTLPFPYPTLSVTYGGVYGMEYPMIVFCGRQQLEKDGRYTEATRHGFVSLVIHEVGHNFFPMIISSDERRWMWLDEGLNTYLENLTKATFEPLIREKEAEAERARVRAYLASGQSQPIMGHPLTIREMGANAYLKVACGLEALRHYILTPKEMDTAFQRYARTWAFRHPEPWDFFRMLSSAIGQELGWFWRGWFLDTSWVDIAIDTVTIEKAEVESEVAEALLAEESAAVQRYLEALAADTASLSFYTSRHPEVADSFVQANYLAYQRRLRERRQKLQEAQRAAEAYLRKKGKVYAIRLRLRNLGRLVWPIWLRLEYPEGVSSLWYFPAEAWAKQTNLLAKVLFVRQPIVRAEIDPFGLSLDLRRGNNTYFLRGGSEGAPTAD
ncbi:MAG: M1 family metallopeptidase [Bacteroidia bacterium]|nr:M1 family metallopeptidase [Bacteroidia bacterium]MDW8088307.1 M1 family metallopeptidase [Bacteroidia bacterium]